MVRDTAIAPVPTDVTVGGLAGMVWRNARQAPRAVQFVRAEPDSRAWRCGPRTADGAAPVTCRQFRDDVAALARGFVAAGVRAGDRVGLMSRTRYEWTLVDYALWSVGAVSVPVYDTASPDQVAWILADAGAAACVVETAGHTALLAGLRAALPVLRHVWCVDAGDLVGLADRGRAVDPTVMAARHGAVSDDDLATIIYTSGTTGRPKGCPLTHRNILRDVDAATSVLPQLFRAQASTVLFLPLAHAFARLLQVGAVHRRVTLTHGPDPAQAVDLLHRFRPTFVLAVPRMFEKLHDRVRQQADAGHRGRPVIGAARRRLAGFAYRIAVAYSERLDTVAGPGLGLRLAHRFADLVAYRRLRQVLGGRCRLVIVGGAPLSERLAHFFRGAGILLLEGYGLTETSPALTANRPDGMRIGTVGRPLPGVQLTIADDGEVLARGDVVFRGYWNAPAATREVFTPDGWLRTGDLGTLDADGFLRITGRKKEIIVTASGKNVAPAPIEARIRAHPLVSQCMLVGDGRPYVAALVTLDPQELDRWRDAHGRRGVPLAELRTDPALCAEVQAAVDQANRSVSRAEAVKAFRVLPRDLSEAAGELTPTGKIRRDVVRERYAADLAALYAGH